jgi:hypothetical protein
MRAALIATLLLIAPMAWAQSEASQGDVEPGKAAAAPKAEKKPGLDVSKLPFTEYSIKEVVKFHAPDIQKCYESVIAEMGKNPPEGKVVVSFTILPTGLTTNTKVDKKQTTIKSDRVQDCVTDSVRAWEFPKPSDGREHPIVYPFALKVTK